MVVGIVQSHWAESRCCSIPWAGESVLFNPTELGVGVVQSHWAGSRSWLIPPGWQLVVDLTGLRDLRYQGLRWAETPGDDGAH